MLDLIEAEPWHRQYLQHFWCAPITFRSAKKLRVPHPDLYAIRVQSIIRDLRPRIPHPGRLYICFLDDLEMVKSVGWAKFISSTDGHHRASFYVLATHQLYTAQGAGQLTYMHVLNNLIGLAQDEEDFQSLTITALVHPANEGCIRLLSRNGWVHAGMDIDGLHEEWALAVGVQE